MDHETHASRGPGPLAATLRLEGLAVAALGFALYTQAEGGWGLFALLILAPDLAMAGYALGPRLGALAYNLTHSYLAPLVLLGCAWLTGFEALWLVALIWIIHIGLDRALGYGLKYASGFKDTHLGRL